MMQSEVKPSSQLNGSLLVTQVDEWFRRYHDYPVLNGNTLLTDESSSPEPKLYSPLYDSFKMKDAGHSAQRVGLVIQVDDWFRRYHDDPVLNGTACFGEIPCPS
jgi:hypothetical protein